MSKRTESNVYTVVFAVVMVIIVATLLSAVSLATKDRRDQNERLEKKKNILFSMGVTDEEDSTAFVSSAQTDALFDEYIKKQYVLVDDSFQEDPEAYLIDLKKEQDKEKAGESSRKPIFVAEKDGETIYIIPVRGNGLWDAIWGFVALNKDLVIQGVFFDHKGETPGLGAEIKAGYFQKRFLGEHIMSENGSFAGVTVLKGNNDPKNDDKQDNEVDVISGATITCDGVSAMIIKGLKPYVDKLDELK